MKKIVFVVAGVAGAGLVYWLASPLFVNQKISESLEDIPGLSAESETSLEAGNEESLTSTIKEEGSTAPTKLSSGKFIGLAGHNGQGTATLLKVGEKYYVRFEDDFHVTNGPDLFVHFGKDGQYTTSAQIAPLKGNAGGQNYEVPANINPSDFNEVWVWCRAFSVPFAKAILQ